MSKRPRHAQGRSTRAKRPVEKQIFVVNTQLATGTQNNSTLKTVTFPCTLSGFSVSGSWFSTAGQAVAVNAEMVWAIVVVREGFTVNTASLASGASLYNPEQDVVLHGSAGMEL